MNTKEDWRTTLCKETNLHLYLPPNKMKTVLDFIETQISLAEKRGAEKMKAQCLAVIPTDTPTSMLNTMDTNDRIESENVMLWEIRNSISSL